jgi:hypothetical protein
VKAIILGFPEQQRRSWQTAFDTNEYPTVQSLIRAIMQESTRIHSNSDKLQEQTDFEAREPRHAGSKNEGGGRGSGKWSRKGGKSKGRGGGKSADVEPYFQGRCDNCGAHGHKAVSCRQPVRQTWQPGHDVRGGKKDASRDYVKGKSGKKGFGQRKGEKSGKKGKKGKFGRDASVADGVSAEMPTVAAAMQPGALVEFGRDGDSYEAVFGDDESTLRTGGGQATYPRIAKRGLLLSRGHRADLATTRPKRFELWPGSRALLSFKTVYNTFENRRMHQCWWGGCGHVMALHSMPAEWANGFGSGCAHFWRQSH